MAEIEDNLLRGEFAAFRDAYGPAVHPSGPAAVRATVRRRRRRTAAVTAAAVVLAVAVPVGANAALNRRPSPPPVPGQTAAPTPSASTSPSTPPPSRSPDPAGTPSAAPDGRVTRPQLLAARVDLPDWSSYVPDTCITEDVRLGPGRVTDAVPVLLGDPGYADTDSDGATETVALVGCRTGEASAKQVVAFDRDDDGRIVTLGRVVGTREGMDDITAFTVEPDGDVRVQVADLQPCCGTAPESAHRQWRTYRWTGERFAQVGGPTQFPTKRPVLDLSTTATDLVLGPPDGSGLRQGTVTVTITNRGDTRIGHVLLLLTVPDSVDPAEDGWSQCREAPDLTGAEAGPHCLLGPLDADERRTVALTFSAPAAAAEGTGRAAAFIASSGGFSYDDADQRNDEAEFAVRHTG